MNGDGEKRNGRVFIDATHHSDLTWKWKYEEYAELRAWQFAQVAEWFEKHPEFHFHVEQAETLRVCFEKSPKMLPVFKKAFDEGRLSLTGGNSIPDQNMCFGESFARNLKRGQLFYKEVFGKTTETGNLDDAFGMHFQTPQLLALAGFKFLLPGRLANAPKGTPSDAPFIWKGPNGSKVVVANSMFWIDAGSRKQSTPISHSPEDCQLQSVRNIRISEREGDILVVYNNETDIFFEGFFELFKKMNKEPGERLVEFGSVNEYCKRIDVSKLPVVQGEFNPTFTGCYTTRIEVKKKLRAAENALFAAEMLAAGRGIDAKLEKAWRELELASFHDAACGCHHDAPHKQIMRKLGFAKAQAEKLLKKAAPAGLSVFNPSSRGGVKIVETDDKKALEAEGVALQRSGKSVFMAVDVPAFGIAPLKHSKPMHQTVKNGKAKFSVKRYDVDFSGVEPKIVDKLSKRNIFPKEGFGEIYFRMDRGTMWVESMTHHWYGKETQKESVESISEGALFHEIVTVGEVLPNPEKRSIDGSKYSYWDALKSIKFRKTWRFFKEMDYFTLKLNLDWRGDSTKIQIRFPVEFDAANAKAEYDTPFGRTERAPYFEVPEKFESSFKPLTGDSCNTAKGDWPALHWIDYSDASLGLALANSGTPGHQLCGGAILVSLIRSGTACNDGSMKPQPGAFDNGAHEYEFAFLPHKASDKAAAPALGEVLNRKCVFLDKPGKGVETKAEAFISGLPENIIVSSMRKEGGRIIVRLYENAGRAVEAPKFERLGSAKLEETNLLESEWRPVQETLRFAPFEIKTVAFQVR